jgi:anti-sigma regulatory factor (Ser/Thr protein kinase)
MNEAMRDPKGRWRSAVSFDVNALQDLRRMVAEAALAAGMAEDRIVDFVLAASEVGTNTVAHGGGRGTALLWREPDALMLEVHDPGRFSRLPIPDARPQPTEERGRGLWIVDQLCDAVRIRSGTEGTFVRLRMALA